MILRRKKTEWKTKQADSSFTAVLWFELVCHLHAVSSRHCVNTARMELSNDFEKKKPKKKTKGRRQKPWRSCVTPSPPSRLISSSGWGVELPSVVRSDTVYVRSPDWKQSRIWLIFTHRRDGSHPSWLSDGTSGQILVYLTGLQWYHECSSVYYWLDKKIILSTRCAKVERSSHGISITHCLIVNSCESVFSASGKKMPLIFTWSCYCCCFPSFEKRPLP